MTLPIGTNALIAFMLVLVRASAWLVIAPPFNTKAIPSRVKLGLAGSLAIVMASRVNTTGLSLETSDFIVELGFQIGIGLVLGYVVNLLFGAMQAAGELIDLFGGFSLSQAFDPMSNIRTSVFGRFYNFLTITLLFVTGGHLLLLKGFMTSFDAMPLSGPSIAHIQQLLLGNLAMFFVAAVEIAAPLLATLFLADVVLGLLAKAAPQMNVLMLAFPFKILITLTLVGLAIPLLPGAVNSMVNHILHTNSQMARAK